MMSLMACSQHGSEKSFVENEYGGKYDLPSDFYEAIEYIEANSDSIMPERAYQQLIVENAESFHYDFSNVITTISHTTSSDGRLKIYYFNCGMHDDTPILQFINSKGDVVVVQITLLPLYLDASNKEVTERDYKYGYHAAHARLHGHIDVDNKTTYIFEISDYNHYETEPGELCGFITGLQLTDDGYRYVNIFDDSFAGQRSRSYEDEYYERRIRSIESNGPELRHSNLWYDQDNLTLYIPRSYDNPKEMFYAYEWNSDKQRFVYENYQLGSAYHRDINQCLERTWGLEIVMYFGDLLIRVDRGKNSYKYTSWGEGKTMADVPDLMLSSGVLNEQSGTLHFVNNEYEYIVPCANNLYNNKLVVKKKGEIISTREIKD